MRRRAIRLDPRDNVVTALEELPAGTEIVLENATTTLTSVVPTGHKVALGQIGEGESVVKYGQPIGHATSRIARGEHVHVHNLASLRGSRDGQCTTAEPSESFLEGAGLARDGRCQREGARAQLELACSSTFMGYRRPDGSVGIRNHILVLPTVGCVNAVVEGIRTRLSYIVALTHPYGCTQLAPDLEQTKRVLVGLATHPNVAAVVLVSLGCESMPFEEIAELITAAHKPLRHLVVQEEGGVSVAVTRGVAWVEELVRGQTIQARERVSLAELVVATECGASDAMSGLSANPATGIASDLIVAAGGTLILSETPEFIGAEHLLAARAVDECVAERILDIVGRREAEARSVGVELRGTQPTPGNIAGGISTIEEKSLGAIRKAGTGAVREVVGYGMHPSQKGLVIMDTPGYDPSSISGMVAGGAHLVLFTTGRGSPIGAPLAPVIKVASNSEIARRLKEHIDIDAGTIVEGAESVGSVGARILEEVVRVASGRLTKAERCGHYDLAIARLGPEL